MLYLAYRCNESRVISEKAIEAIKGWFKRDLEDACFESNIVSKVCKGKCQVAALIESLQKTVFCKSSIIFNLNVAIRSALEG